MSATRRDYREWIRAVGLNIATPYQERLRGTAEFADALPGDEPPWAEQPSNYQIDLALQSACFVVNQQVNLSDTGQIRRIPVSGTTDNGPLQISLATIPGLPERSIISIRRLWWDDGVNPPVLIPPFILSDADNRNDPYMADSPSVPMRQSIEGYYLYLDPPPATAGFIRFMAGCGVLFPETDDQSYDQIPAAYDQNVNLIALQFLAKSDSTNATMRVRAADFASDTAAGLERLKAWFNGGSNEEVQPVVIFDATAMRRFRRWR